jgi:pimeloyl-ACP methyl ester carboxylesterase
VDVEVLGGPLRVGTWGTGAGAPVLAVHGITANHLAWQLVAEALPDLRIIAPDLRGRGRSSGLPAPYGMAQHADDLAQLIDQLGLGPVPIVGHSMGGFVAVTTAHRHPDLISGVLLLDGGLPFVVSPEVDLDRLVAAALGPALERLDLTFDGVEAYRAFWRRHPALEQAWGPALIDYIDYDLTGDPPRMHSTVSAEAVRTDARQQFATSVDDQVLAPLSRPMTMITAPRGLLGAPPGLYPTDVMNQWRALLPALDVEELDDVNHYTMVMSAAGVAQIASRVAGLAARNSPKSDPS